MTSPFATDRCAPGAQRRLVLCALRGLVLCALALALAVQGLVVSALAVPGPEHRHEVRGAAQVLVDFRRIVAGYGNDAFVHATPDGAHAAVARHHHERTDPSVRVTAPAKAAQLLDADAATLLAAALATLPPGLPPGIRWAVPALRDQRAEHASWVPVSTFGRRLERPPRSTARA